MKKSYLFVTLLAGLALAASACAPSPASASSSPQGGTGNSSASGSYGYGSSAQSTAAPAQEASPAPTAASGQSSGSQDLGGGAYGPASGAATSAPAESSASMSTVNVADNSQYGSILVDQNGMTLYLFLNDTQGAGTSACTGACSALWPALTATSPTAGSGVDASKLGTITLSDGSMQVTYNGWPLYTYAKDTKAGDTTGQGVKAVWYVVAPSGDAMK